MLVGHECVKRYDDMVVMYMGWVTLLELLTGTRGRMVGLPCTVCFSPVVQLALYPWMSGEYHGCGGGGGVKW